MAGAHDHRASGPIPFWVHQLVELLLGALLLLQGARTGEHTLALVGLGAALLLLALCSDGALAAWPWIGRGAHRVADFAAATVLAVSPLVLGFTQALAIVLVELAAGALVWLAFQTNWRRSAPRQTRAPDGAAPTPAPTTQPARAPETGPPLPRRFGTAVGRARDDGPRRLGKAVGRARRAGRAARTTSPPPDPTTPGDPPPGP